MNHQIDNKTKYYFSCPCPLSASSLIKWIEHSDMKKKIMPFVIFLKSVTDEL